MLSMPHDYHLSVATTTSGLIGGVSRAVSAEMTLSSISFQGMIDVAFYAVVSASVGYCVKVAWDKVFKSVRNSKSKEL